MEIQQSKYYADYIRSLKWNVLSIDHINIFYKHFPLISSIAKIHRPNHLPNPQKLITLLKSHRINMLSCEPVSTINQSHYHLWMMKMDKHFRLNKSPFLPTKTNIIDITSSEKKLFDSFSSAKRRAVRRAKKLGVIIRQSNNIHDLVTIKNKSAGLFGGMTTSGIKQLWPIFAPKHAVILLAYKPQTITSKLNTSQLIGGVLLLFWKKRAYYWIAGATQKGKKLFAPTLLVWESLKTAKKYGCHEFDFVGVYDERIPKISREWKGFTKFKEGFGGSDVYYPIYKY